MGRWDNPWKRGTAQHRLYARVLHYRKKAEEHERKELAAARHSMKARNKESEYQRRLDRMAGGYPDLGEDDEQ